MEENIERTCKLKVKENMECEMRKREKETLCTENAHQSSCGESEGENKRGI